MVFEKEKKRHVCPGLMACGGLGHPESCYTFSNGKWTKMDLKLMYGRTHHCSWYRQNGDVVLIGRVGNGFC